MKEEWGLSKEVEEISVKEAAKRLAEIIRMLEEISD